MSPQESSYAARQDQYNGSITGSNEPPESPAREWSFMSSPQSVVHRNGWSELEFQDDARKLGIEVANEQPYLMVWGSPQTGKSTFLKEIGFKALQRIALIKASREATAPQLRQKRYAHDCIPVMIELSQFNPPGFTVKTLITKAFADCGFTKPQAFTELCLRQGRLLILLDTLDAVSPSVLPQAIADIENLIERYGKNRFVVASRTSVEIADTFKQFRTVAIAPFTDNQIQQFIAHWFGRSQTLETPIAKRCWQQLNSPDCAAAKQLAKTPLLLTLLCTTYTTFRGFPKSPPTLYGAVLTLLLRKGIALERRAADSLPQKLDLDLALALLAEIAHDSFEDHPPWFRKHSVLSRIQQFQTSNDNAPNLSPGKIFRAFEGSQGILVKQAQGVYSFAHPAFQAYLTAKYLVDNQKVESFVSDRLTDRRWRGVFLLVAGLLSGRQGADGLLLAMERQAQTWLAPNRLQTLAAWTAATTQTVPESINTAASRVVALVLLLALTFVLESDTHSRRGTSRLVEQAHALANALGYQTLPCYKPDLDLIGARTGVLAWSRTLAQVDVPDSASEQFLALSTAMSLTHDLTQAFHQLGVLDRPQLETLVQQLTALNDYSAIQNGASDEPRDRALYIWLTALQLQADLWPLSDQEIVSFSNYLYAMELIICCKDAAVRVSPQVWQGIQARILRGGVSSYIPVQMH